MTDNLLPTVFRAGIGGYTGDGLGAMAQLGEIAVMVVLAGAWA